MILFRFFIAGLLVYLLWRLFRFRSGSDREGGKKAQRSTAAPEEMKQDPVCGTWVPVSQAIKIEHMGSQLYFCSPKCRDRFLADHSSTTD